MMAQRVLLIGSFADSVRKFRGPLIEELQAKGVQVHVAVPDFEGAVDLKNWTERQDLGLHNIPLRRTGTNPFADVMLLVRLYRLMRQLRPSATLSYTIKPVIYGTIAAWLAGVQQRYALVTGLGYAFTESRKGVLIRVVRILYRFALGKAEKVIFQNPDDERMFRELQLLPAFVPSVVVNGSGVDLLEFSMQPLPYTSPVFLMIGRLLGDKGVREYAQAAREVKATFPFAVFRLAGWIDSNPDAVTRVELDQWVQDGTLEFLGKLEDVRPAIAEATVYVLPSYREGTPRTVLEAMAMGRPIITTDAPGCRETVIEGENGYLVPLKSVDGLVEAMQRFLHNPRLAARMGRRSREIAEDKYDVAKVNAVMLREMGIARPVCQLGDA